MQCGLIRETDVLGTVNSITPFWNVRPCNLVEVYPHVGGTCVAHLQDEEQPWLNIYQNTRRHIPECSSLHGFVCFMNMLSWIDVGLTSPALRYDVA
jgi:hypothetical protein